MKKFMRFLHIPDSLINQMALEALRLNENENHEVVSIIPKFDVRALPMDSKGFAEWDTWLKVAGNDIAPAGLVNVLVYLRDRGLGPFDYPFYYTNKIGFNNRLIIPFMYKGDIVGWTARAINDAKPKYMSEQQPGYVFNLDNQTQDREFVIVMEGPFDALSIDGCAILGAEIHDSQNWLIRQLGKEIILVPDRDADGFNTVERAIELGWSVSLPNWPPGVKDVNDAVLKLGKLATLWLIVEAKESMELKIRLRAKQWFKEKNEENT